MRLVWETLQKSWWMNAVVVLRAKVPGGWLVQASRIHGVGICFYPDPDHVWDGSSLP